MQKCIILGNSPSMQGIDLSSLNANFTVVTVNKGWLLRENGLKYSDYHVITDPNFIQEYKGKIPRDFCRLLVGADDSFDIRTKSPHLWTVGSPFKFSTDLSSLWTSESVVSEALQFVVSKGFKEIYFMGVDLTFNQDEAHFYASTSAEKYRNDKFSMRNKEQMYRWLEGANQYLKEQGIILINSSADFNSLPFMLRYRDLYKEKHNEEDYGKDGLSSRALVEGIIKQHNVKSVLDYGAGKGDLAKAVGAYEYEPAFGKTEMVDVDLITCTDVLEHIPEWELDGVLKHIFSHCNMAFFNLCYRPAIHFLSNGDNCHCTVKPYDWWENKLSRYGDVLRLTNTGVLCIKH